MSKDLFAFLQKQSVCFHLADVKLNTLFSYLLYNSQGNFILTLGFVLSSLHACEAIY